MVRQRRMGDNTKPSDDFWVEFARSMGGLAMPGAEFIAALIGAAGGQAVQGAGYRGGAWDVRNHDCT